MIEELLKRLKEEYPDEATITTNIKACYYILPDGRMLSIGYEYNCRSNDHRAIFSADDEIEYNDWKSLHKKYSLVGYAPETNCSWIAKNQVITIEQRKILEKYNIELITENF